MEPTIYKSGAYKTPGIYKGAGGIYKGRGVYNDGATPPGFFYDFNLSRFDLDTLKDGDVQWNCSQPNYTLSKESDCLAVNFSGSSLNFFFRPDIDKTKKIFAEYTISLQIEDYTYVGFGYYSYNFLEYEIGRGNYFQNSAIVATIKNYNLYNGGQYSTIWTNNIRFDRFPYVPKAKIRIKLEPDGHGKLYINDILSIDGYYDGDYDTFMDNFLFRFVCEVASGSFKLYSLKIWQE